MTTALTRDELTAVVRAAQGRDRIIIRLLAGSGLRASELCALDVGDVRANPIRLRAFKGRGNSRYRSDRQEVTLPVELHRDLVEWVAGRADNEPLFVSASTGSAGHRLTRQAVGKILRRAGVAAGVSHVHPHRLRHTLASTLMDAGTPLHVTQAILRHADPRSTLRYSHPSTEAIAAAVEAVMV